MIAKYGDRAEQRLAIDYKIIYKEKTGKFICQDKRSPFYGNKTVATYKRK